MEIQEVENRVVDIIGDVLFLKEDAKLTDTLADKLAMDDLDRDAMYSELEDEFDIEVDDTVGTKWNTVQDVVTFVHSKTNSV